MIYSVWGYGPWRLNIQLPIVTLGAKVDLASEEIIYTPWVITETI